MERGICIVENKIHLEEYRNYFFANRKNYIQAVYRKNNYDIRLHKIYDENGNFLHYDKLVVEKIGGVKIVAKMVETKFQFRGKFKIVRYDVAVFGEKIYYTSDYNVLDFCQKRIDIPKYLVIVFSHGLVCVVFVRAWNEEYHDEFMGKKIFVGGKYKFELECVEKCLRDEPSSVIAEQIKANLLEMIKNEN